MNKGKVYLVGAGPGDPGLMSVIALKTLKNADVVVYDRLIGKKILEKIPKKAEKLYVGKSSGNHSVTQDNIGRILVEKAHEGKKVVRLKGGDPFLFGRGGEEAEELVKAGLKFEVIPGITSAIAVPTYAGIPVTHRDYSSSVAIVTGHEKRSKGKVSVDWGKIATAVDTIVVLMGIENLDEITKALINGGLSRETPAAVIEWGTTSQQRTTQSTLQNIARKAISENVKPPGVLVIGEVVNLRKDLSWFEGELK